MTNEERRKIEDAKGKATIWNSAKSLFTDNFFFTNR